MNTKNTMLFVVRRNSLLFVDRLTGMRYDAPIHGEQLPNIPAYLRLANVGKGERSADRNRTFQDLGLREHFPVLQKRRLYGLRNLQWVAVVPDDLQASEERLIIDYMISELSARRTYLVSLSAVVGREIEKPPIEFSEHISATNTFRSCAVTYFGNKMGEPQKRFYPLESFDRETLDAALSELCPGRQLPIYVDDMEGTGRWNHLGIPVSLDQAIENVWNGLEQIKI